MGRVTRDQVWAAITLVCVLAISWQLGKAIADGSALLPAALIAAVAGWLIVTHPIAGLVLVVVTTLGLPWELGDTGASIVRLSGAFVVGCYALKVLHERLPVRLVSYSTIPFACFIAWRSMGILRTRSDEAAFWVSTAGSMTEYFGRVAMYLVLYLLILNVCRSAKHVRWIAAAIIITATASAAFAFLIYFDLAPAMLSDAEAALLAGRISGLRANPNEASIVATMAIGLLLPFASHGRLIGAATSWFDRLAARRAVTVSLIVLITAAVILSGSRGAVFVLLGLLVVSGLLMTARGIGVTIAAVAALTAVLTLAPPESTVVTHLTHLPIVSDVFYGESVFTLDSSAAGRYERAMMTFDFLRINPVAGIGYGNYEVEMGERLGYGSSAHNLYAEIAGEEGIVGLALYLWLTGTIFWRLRQAGRLARPHDWTLSLLCRGFFCAFLAFTIDRFFGNGDQLNKLIFLYLGVADVLAELTATYRRQATAVPGPVVMPASPTARRLNPA